MATSTLFFTPTAQRHHYQYHHNLSPSNISFQGLRPLTKAKTSLSKINANAPRKSLAVKAELNPSLVISLSTGLSLFLGRFVFFNFQRENVAKQGLPEQNGVTHFEAGDVRAKEYVSLLKSNDPVGSTSLMFLLGDPLAISLPITSWLPLAMAMTPNSFRLMFLIACVYFCMVVY